MNLWAPILGNPCNTIAALPPKLATQDGTVFLGFSFAFLIHREIYIVGKNFGRVWRLEIGRKRANRGALGGGEGRKERSSRVPAIPGTLG